MSEASELVILVARALVDRPDDVQVEEIPGQRGTVLELAVAKEDIGKVIGKDGRTAQAIEKTGLRAHGIAGRRPYEKQERRNQHPICDGGHKMAQ